ncbi:MAG: hypothetical protein H0X08_09525, partial [Blastocatellia bacterium]|nr:hypothetical protein [Blastocatellia bacterium]
SLLQRHLSIGYGRAAKILDSMVREGMVGEMDGSTRARPILDQAAIALMDLRPHPESLEMQSEAPVVREAPIQARMPFLLHLSRFFAFAAVVLFVIGLGSCAASLGGDGENTPNTFIIGLFSLIFCILLAMLSACCYLLCSPSSTAATVPPNDSRPRRKSYRRRGKRGGGIMKTVRSQIKKYGD